MNATDNTLVITAAVASFSAGASGMLMYLMRHPGRLIAYLRRTGDLPPAPKPEPKPEPVRWAEATLYPILNGDKLDDANAIGHDGAKALGHGKDK